MNTAITFDDLIKIAVVIMAIWGFVKIIMEIVKEINARHDKEQKWDEMENSLNVARENIVVKYDSKLSELEKSIAENYADTEAKLQEIKSEQFILTSSMFAVLDGLKQLNCNGNVSKAYSDLEHYLNEQAHH